MPAPRIGVVLCGEDMAIDELVDFAVGLEDAGFDSVWHEEIFREPFVPLAAIAARTSRLKLGPSVSTWVRTPVSSALMAANLDQLSNGRYVVAFLASDAAAFVQGATLVIDGGWAAR